MWRVVKLSNKLHAVQLPFHINIEEDINGWLSSGDPVIFCSDLEDLDRFGIDVEEIQIHEWNEE